MTLFSFPNLTQRRVRKALTCMTLRQQQLFRDFCMEDAGYDALAARYKISIDEVKADLVVAFLMLDAALDGPVSWWERLWQE